MLAAMPLVLAAACADSDSDSPGVAGRPGTAAVGFTADMTAAGSPLPAAGTRAANAINDLTTLQAKAFGVFGCYTGLYRYLDSNVRPDFMYNERVWWQEAAPPASASWTYTPLKYWPNGEGETTGAINTGELPHYVSFFAYAPYSDNATGAAGYCIPSFSSQADTGNPWLTYRLHDDVGSQVDLLLAQPQLDQTKPAVDADVHFSFKHALACAGEQLTVACSTGLKNQTIGHTTGSATEAQVVVTAFSIEYTLIAKARLVLWNSALPDWATADPVWQAIQSESPTCTRTVTIIDPATDAPVPVYHYVKADPEEPVTEVTWADKGVFYIPLPVGQTEYVQRARVSVTYHITTLSGGSWVNDADNIGTATLILSDYTDAYKAGKNLNIDVTLNQMDIALRAAITAWQTTDPQEVEGEEQ